VTPLEVVTDALAAYRLTRFVTADGLTDHPRDRIVEAAYVTVGRAEQHRPHPEVRGAWSEEAMHDPDPPKLAELVTCRWCAGFWLSVGVVAARRVVPRWWDPLATALAFSAGAVLVARLEDG
jgi:hypothetical protein